MTKARRQQHIRDLVARNEISSQEELLALLATEGVSSTQATLSRDLRELGAVKRGGFYHITTETRRTAAERRELAKRLKSLVTQVDRGGNLVVLHTRPGQAQAIALEIDQASADGVMGAIAGMDTVFVATRTAADARRLQALIAG